MVQGFRGLGWVVTAIVTTTDCGSGSGVIRSSSAFPRRVIFGAVLSRLRHPRPDLQALVELFELRFLPYRTLPSGIWRWET